MHFCTLFDSNYISKGIALYLSIEKHTTDFILYVMAMDRKCQELLSALAFERVVVDCIEDIDDPELVKARNDRSRAEFCWTCGSYSTEFFLRKYELPDITYLDSDLMFFCSPQVVFDELEKKNASVGITPHFTRMTVFGRYCVQYVFFKNDAEGRKCLRWWRDECLRWCYSKLEDGKYGDQRYLDSFSGKFANVCDIENRGVGIAYWNADRYRFESGKVKYNGRDYPQVFFHYSGFTVSVAEGVLSFRHTMFLTQDIRRFFVEPYAALMKTVFSQYLSIPITETVIAPVNKWDYAAKAVVHYLGKVLPVDRMMASVMRLKYKTSHKPYSERI